MIRGLKEKDRSQVMNFLAPERALNLFIIGDLENFGFETDFQELWGDLDRTGRLRAVLLRYYGSFILYAPGDFDVAGVVELLRQNRERMEALSGTDRVLRRIEVFPEVLPAGAGRRVLYFTELKSEEKLGGTEWPAAGERENLSGFSGPLRATVDDIPDFVRFWSHIREFTAGVDSEDRNRREMESGASRVYLFRLGGHGDLGRRDASGGVGGPVVATVKTTAENSLSAMIVGVATHPDYRRRGLATSLLEQLCRELLAEGRRPCLFYDSPAAGTIYRRLGFTDIGTWVMYLSKKA